MNLHPIFFCRLRTLAFRDYLILQAALGRNYTRLRLVLSQELFAFFFVQFSFFRLRLTDVSLHEDFCFLRSHLRRIAFQRFRETGKHSIYIQLSTGESTYTFFKIGAIAYSNRITYTIYSCRKICARLRVARSCHSTQSYYSCCSQYI